MKCLILFICFLGCSSFVFADTCPASLKGAAFVEADFVPDASSNPEHPNERSELITCLYASSDSAYEEASQIYENAHPVIEGSDWVNRPGSNPKIGEFHCPGVNEVEGVVDPARCPFAYNESIQ